MPPASCFFQTLTKSSMPLIDLEKLLPAVVALSKQAGARILEIYDQGFDVVQKEDNTPVTIADHAAHAIIDDGLEEIADEFPVLSEESTTIPLADRMHWETYWLVDPLDGTREFIKRNGEFSVNIALVHKHQPILGVIYAPVLEVCYYAGKGMGAFKLERAQKPKPIHVCKQRREKLIIAGSRSHQTPRFKQFLANVGPYELLPVGSSLKSCLVAEGKADIYARLGPTSEWDTAAAHCIVEEAGGHLTDTNMQTLPYNTKESLLNPPFFVFGDSHVNWSDFL